MKTATHRTIHPMPPRNQQHPSMRIECRMSDKEVNIEITFDIETIEVDTDRLEELAGQICGRFDVCPVTISIAIVGDEEMLRVNKEFLDSDEQTDVISFDLSDENETLKVFELVVNADQALRQAQSRGHLQQAELALYVTHGLLHNVGFDDIDEEDARKMHTMEETISNPKLIIVHHIKNAVSV